MANYSHHWIGTVLNRGYKHTGYLRVARDRRERSQQPVSNRNSRWGNNFRKITPLTAWYSMICRVFFPFQAFSRIFNHYFPIGKTCLEPSRRCLWTATMFGTTRSSKYTVEDDCTSLHASKSQKPILSSGSLFISILFICWKYFLVSLSIVAVFNLLRQ